MKTAKVINQGSTQSISLPDEFRLEGTEVFVKRVGSSLLLIPKGADLWQILEKSLSNFTSDFMEDRSQPPTQPREALFE